MSGIYAIHLSAYAQLTVELAEEAVRFLRNCASLPCVAIHKSPGDFASELDVQIETLLKKLIVERYLEHGFLGEEGGGLFDFNGPIWIIDPIDGSVNFVRGYPQYSVSIALVIDGEPVVACIADPCRAEVFSATLGEGAFLNGKRLHVASTDNLAYALAATVFPKPNAPFMHDYLRQFDTVARQTAGVRRAGSMALELAYLAAGRVDLFWKRGMGAWDAAAGVLLIREAGGEVFTLYNKLWIHSAEICASIPALSVDWRSLIAK